ncbi:MAG: hypothetical protein WCV88_00490 [Patescibacteria group bacterium]|jgi:hypothetical protein
MLKKPVTFIASHIENQPMVIDFYTKEGKFVEPTTVKKEKTKAGINLYVESVREKR